MFCHFSKHDLKHDRPFCSSFWLPFCLFCFYRSLTYRWPLTKRQMVALFIFNNYAISHCFILFFLFLSLVTVALKTKCVYLWKQTTINSVMESSNSRLTIVILSKKKTLYKYDIKDIFYIWSFDFGKSNQTCRKSYSLLSE